MKRFIVTPFEWGSGSGFDFLNNDNPEADVVHNPHISYAPANLTNQRSFRIWEPGRMALSSMGVLDPGPDQPFNVPQIPQGCKVHGIKGTMLITPAGVAEFFDAVTGESLEEQPQYKEIFDPWNGEHEFDTSGGVDPQTVLVRTPFRQSATSSYFMSPQHYAQCPFYITMYKGTFNPYGSTNTEGGNIDSGPSDDPDTLLGVDITNPTVLEQERIVWWDMVMCTVPHRQLSFSTVYGFDDRAEVQLYPAFGSWSRHVTKYNLNLDRNWIVKDDQVLWLHVMPGIVDTGVFWADSLGAVHRIMYRPSFSVDLVASMLATPFTPGV